MQKENKITDYKLSYLIAQTVMCVILILVFLVLKYLKTPQSDNMEKWYKENFEQNTKVETVTDTPSDSDAESSISSSYDENSNAVNTSLDLSKTQTVTKTAKYSLNSLVWPVSSGVITSDYGYRSDPFTTNNALHKGIDIAVNMGTDVVAAADGKVIKSGYEKNGYGNFVMLEHSSGFVTLYAHCSSISVNVGDAVKAGQTVALSGSSGRSTGPHLHFEVRLHNTLLNPLWILPLNDEI